ncbi:hypothetical protein PJL18_04241 [Paenarthrobacter nicotinovorans]|nr:hypothetical protein [Paenarthrobacter nicotinovorans]
MLGTVAAQALHHAAENEVAVGFQDHVDEVDDDDAADVTQAKLANDFLGSFKVVLGNCLFQVSTTAGELTCVDVHHRHGFGAVNDQRATGRQEDLAFQSLVDLLIDAPGSEDVLILGPFFKAAHEVGGNIGYISLDGVPGVVTGDDQLGEVLVEDVTDNLDGEVRFAVKQFRCQHLGGGSLPFDTFPLRAQTVDVVGQFFFRGTFSGRTDDDSGVFRQAVLQDPLEAVAFDVGQLARDAGHGSTRHVHKVAARK